MTIDTQKLRDGPYLREGRETMRIMAEAADIIDAQAAQLAAYPADWRSDSSLETWFPLTAEQLKAQAAAIAECRRILAGVPQNAIDGGWTAAGISAYAKGLETDNKQLREALGNLIRGYINALEAGRNRIIDLGGQCDPLDVMEASDPWLRAARAAKGAA